MQQIQPLPKALYDQLVAAGIDSFTLEFQGGNDEGYLEIDHAGKRMSGKIHQAIEDWAWSAYRYSGGGNGSNFGDNITYDLKNKTASCSDWSMVRTDGPTHQGKLQVK
jgi:hypothetical protein